MSFVGREMEAAEVLALVIAHRVLLVYAPSGAGKSSLINAGLIPLIEAEGAEVMPVARVSGAAGRQRTESDRVVGAGNPFVLNTLLSWAGEVGDELELAGLSLARYLQIATPLLCRRDLKDSMGLARRLRTGKHPLLDLLRGHLSENWRRNLEELAATDRPGAALEQALVEALNRVISGPGLCYDERFRDLSLGAEPPTAEAIKVRGDQLAYMNRRLLDAALPHLIETISDQAPPPRRTDEEGLPLPRIVIFDQFEELFTTNTEHWSEREAFFIQVADALDWDPTLHVVFVMREEYIAQLDPYVHLVPDKLRARFHMERLGPSAAERAVEEPPVKLQTGRCYAPGVARGLVRQLLREHRVDTQGKVVSVVGPYVEPVQLQVVCTKLWDRLRPEVTVITEEMMTTFGDVDRALADYCSESIQLAASELGRGPGWMRSLPLLNQLRRSQLLSWIGHELITPAGTRSIVFRGPQHTGGMPNAAVDVLAGRHVVRTEMRAGAEWCELTHDRFIEPIQAACAEQQRQKLHLMSLAAVVLVAVAFLGGVALTRSRPSAYNRPLLQAAPVSSLDVSPDGKSIVITINEDEQGNPGAASVLDLTTGQERQRLPSDLDSVWSARFSPSGRRIVTVDRGTVILWDTASGKVAAKFPVEDDGEVYSVAFNPEGKRIVIAGDDGKASVWDVVDERRLFTLPPTVGELGHTGEVRAAAYSPDGRRVVTGSQDGSAHVWDALTGRSVKVLKQSGPAVNALAFSPDGNRMVIASGDGTATLWNVESDGYAFDRSLNHDSTEVRSVAFRQDGTQVATGDTGGTIRLWSVTSGTLLGKYSPHAKEITGLAFGLNGLVLASSSSDMTVYLGQTDEATGAMTTPIAADRDVGDAGPDEGALGAALQGDRSARRWPRGTSGGPFP